MRRRVPPGATSASTPSANAVSVDIAAPQPCAPRAARVEREVDRDRDRHAAERGEHRDGQPPPLAQLPLVELALGLEADDEEVERHQALVDPLAQVEGDARAAEPDRQLGRPDGLVGVRPRRVRPHERRDRRGQQRRRARRLGVEEVAHRRREVARPRRPPARGMRCVVATPTVNRTPRSCEDSRGARPLAAADRPRPRRRCAQRRAAGRPRTSSRPPPPRRTAASASTS